MNIKAFYLHVYHWPQKLLHLCLCKHGGGWHFIFLSFFHISLWIVCFLHESHSARPLSPAQKSGISCVSLLKSWSKIKVKIWSLKLSHVQFLLPVIHGRCLVCWCPGDARSQAFSSWDNRPRGTDIIRFQFARAYQGILRQSITWISYWLSTILPWVLMPRLAKSQGTGTFHVGRR